MLRGFQSILSSSLGRKASSATNSRLVKMVSNPTADPMKAYVKVLKDEQRIEIKFKYADAELGLNRWFSFNRALDDSLQQVKERIVANIDKACVKHRKKNLKKQGSTVTLEEFKLEVNVTHKSELLDINLSCRTLLELDDVAIAVKDKIFHLDIDPPAVKTLKLPSSMMSGFPIYPSKLEVENCSRKDCKLIWSTSPKNLKTAPDADSDDWVPVGSDFTFTPTNVEIGSWLKLDCIPQNGNRLGLPETVVSSRVLEAGPGFCPFEVRHQFTSEPVNKNGFRVVTYNILADLYCDSDYTRTVLHPYCPPYALAIDYRKQLILKELIGYNADIICLQEVDTKVFDSDLEPTFSSLGFQGIFSKKGGQVSEGVACLFNANKFELIQTSSHVVATELSINPLLADLWQAVQKNEKLRSRVLDRTTSCHLVLLQSIHTGKQIVVANTHLYFHPDADHIRLLQAASGLRLAQDLHRRQVEQGFDVSLLFCGDFNSCPGYGVLEMMTEQNIDKDYPAWASNPEEAVQELSLHNPIAMDTACGTPPFTNYTTGFNGCLDYIFYEKSKLSVEQVVPLPSLEEVTQHSALPSIVFPSDHIALIADLKWL